MPARSRFLFVLLVIAGSGTASQAADLPKAAGANWAQAKKFTREFVDQHVQTANVVPVFIGKTDQFWYAARTTDGTKYWRVDPDKRTKTPLFDHAKLISA